MTQHIGQMIQHFSQRDDVRWDVGSFDRSLNIADANIQSSSCSFKLLSFLQLNKLTGDTADVFLEYIQRNLPEGVSMNVEQTEVVDVPEYIRPPILLTHETIAKKTTDSVAS